MRSLFLGELPNSPGDASISPYPTGTVRSVQHNTASGWKLGDPIVEPEGVYKLPNGHLVISLECSDLDAVRALVPIH